jgi:hypothetical protein
MIRIALLALPVCFPRSPEMTDNSTKCRPKPVNGFGRRNPRRRVAAMKSMALRRDDIHDGDIGLLEGARLAAGP